MIRALLLLSAFLVTDALALVTGLNVQQNSGTFDAAGQAFTKDLGAHSIRIGYRHGDHDLGVNWAHQNGVDVMFMLGYGAECNPETASGRQCYADRSGDLARKYGDKVNHYEVWNEWFGGFGLGRYPACKPACTDPVIYADLLCRTYKAIKAVRPSALVAGGAFAGTNGAHAFAPGLMRAGAGKCMDMFVVHPYPQFQNTQCPAEAKDNPRIGAQCFFDHITRLDNIIKANNGGQSIRFAITETGWHSESAAPTYLREIYSRAKNYPIYGIWWYELEDHPSSGTPKGLVRGNNTRKPAFFEFQKAAGAAPVPPPPPPTPPPPVPPPTPGASMFCELGAEAKSVDGKVMLRCLD